MDRWNAAPVGSFQSIKIERQGHQGEWLSQMPHQAKCSLNGRGCTMKFMSSDLQPSNASLIRGL
jgi:hypothetical protein